jgi:EmrB/QacA subfamily drug resistance transporter
MSIAEPAPAASAAVDPPSGPVLHKGLALFVLAISQLMIVLDATIVNVALERIQVALDFTSQSDLQWVVTGYALTFGGFLLLGGKLADRIGRRKVFILGAVIFAIASLLGGLAQDSTLLIAARALQGLGGALLSPAALSLLTVVFAEGKERDRALGIWAAITAGGAALGLILGGVLTEYLDWRWVFYVNVPIAVLAVVGALAYVPESRDESARGFDVAGAVTVTGGLMALVYGLVKVNDDDLSTGTKTGLFVLAAVLLTAFTVLQRRVASPLLPFRLFHNRSVLGADVASLFIGAGIFGIFFFLTLWMQVLNGYSPIRAGLAFLPMTVLIGVGAGVSASLLGRIGPRPLLLVGPLLSALGLLWLALLLEADSSYVTIVLPGIAMVAIGMGLAFVALTSAAVAGVPAEDAGHRLGGPERRPAGRRRARSGGADRRQHRSHQGPAAAGRGRARGAAGARRGAGPGLRRPGVQRRQRRLGGRLRRGERLPRGRRAGGRGAGPRQQGGSCPGAQGVGGGGRLSRVRPLRSWPGTR